MNAASLESGEVQTIAGNTIRVEVDRANNEVQIDNARFTQRDLQANNGVIHIIDRVILLPNWQQQSDRTQPKTNSQALSNNRDGFKLKI